MKKSIFIFDEIFNLDSPFGDWQNKIVDQNKQESSSNKTLKRILTKKDLRSLREKRKDGSFEAVIHASWWDDRIFKYITDKKLSSANRAKRILEVILVGSLFKYKYDVRDQLINSDDNLEPEKARQNVIDYRDKNWGKDRDFPITLTWSKDTQGKKSTFKEINNELKKNGKAEVQLFSEYHDEKKNNLSHIPQYGGSLLHRGKIVIKKAEGMKDKLKGVQYWSAWFVMNSPFGKMFRNVGKQRDVWDGTLLTNTDRFKMTLDGVLDLLTLGTGAFSAVLNQGLNVIFEFLNQIDEEYLKESNLLPFSREILDMVATLLLMIKEYKDKGKINKFGFIEILANLIQFGLISFDGQKFALNKPSTQLSNIEKKYIIYFDQNL